jgi:hypothetical protein
MLIKDMSELAKGHVASFPNATPKVMAEKLRRHLWTLTCQADIVELTGEIDDFGGDRDVGTNIGKAIVSLLCLGHLLGMDPETAIATIVTELTGHAAPGRQTTDSGFPAALSSAVESAVKKEFNDAAGSVANPDAGETPSSIEFYRTSFREAKERSDIENIWKAVSEDKSLTGQEKFQLQADKKEALKRLT